MLTSDILRRLKSSSSLTAPEGAGDAVDWMQVDAREWSPTPASDREAAIRALVRLAGIAIDGSAQGDDVLTGTTGGSRPGA